MLEKVLIQNFRCLRRVEVGLRPLSVLVGCNDTGKSTFLHAIATMLSPASGTHLAVEDHWQLRPSDPAVFWADLGRGTIKWEPAEQRAGETTRGYHVFASGGIEWPVTSLWALPAAGPSMTSRGRAEGSAAPHLHSSGEGVPTLVDYLLRRDRPRFDAFVDALRARIPGLRDVQIPTPTPEQRRLDLVIENGLTLAADRASAGVRLMLFFVALTYHPSPPDVILLEEPENGVHPRRLADIVKLLRDITKGVHCGHPAQVILTTHSPYLLDHVDLDQDQVLVFRRNDDGSRTAEAVNAERLKTFLNDFMLGELWFNEQEEGLLGRGS